MKFKASIPLALSALVAALALSSPASASTNRTFVASTGSDSNTGANCARTTPCRTFAAALGVTVAGGEIVALDQIGYGTLTINKAITLVGMEGAFISAPSNGTGLVVSAGASDLVIIRNIAFTGQGNTNTVGIQLTSGHLVLQNCAIRNLTTGLTVNNAKADLNNTDIIGNTVGISTTGTGVDTQVYPPAGPTQVRIAYGNVIGNTTAYVMNDPGLRPTPATDNKITVFLELQGNSTANITTNQAGNATLASGTGSSCTTSPNCQSVGTYNLQVNGNQN